MGSARWVCRDLGAGWIDHPLAALVRKAQADSPAPAAPTADGAAVRPSQLEYTADCEYLTVRLRAGCRVRGRRAGPVEVP